MGKTSIIFTSTEAVGGKKLQKTLTDINSAATNAQLKGFAQALNDLTTNNYGETNRVDKINCDTEESGTSKQFRNLTVTGAEKGSTATVSAAISDGETINPAIFYYVNGTVSYLQPTVIASDSATVAKLTFAVPNNAGTLFVGLGAKTAFYADFVVVQVS